MKTTFEITGKVVDVITKQIFSGRIRIKDGVITAIDECQDVEACYILPGLIDAHIHIESSMLIPSEFARLAVVHGTVGTVSDPHEMGNVMGVDGVRFMIENGQKVPFKFSFGAPSCVPATTLETSGATIGLKELDELLEMKEIYGLAEMMNVPGVLYNDPYVQDKLALSKKYGKPVDGHAPGLKGEDAARYIAAGISTDHECFTLDEAEWKIKQGMNVLIREGSAARNFDDLVPLVGTHPERVMFCSDDKHPNDLAKGHMNDLVKRAIQKGFDPLDVIRCCTFNPVQHYHLLVGLVQVGDPADFIVVDDLSNFNVIQTYIDGQLVAEKGESLIDSIPERPMNFFKASPVSLADVTVVPESGKLRIIKLIEGQLITDVLLDQVEGTGTNIESSIDKDILKMVVKDRYTDRPVAVGFVHGFGLKEGAFASSIAHDSHNVIAVGTSDQAIVDAMNMIIGVKGGISLVTNEGNYLLSLPFGGIMTGDDGFVAASAYEKFDHLAKSIGAKPEAPFMTLSFLALLVIPKLKLSDQGLFDGERFEFVDLFEKVSPHM